MSKAGNNEEPSRQENAEELLFSDLISYPAPDLQSGIVEEVKDGYHLDNIDDWAVWNEASPFGANFEAELYHDSSVFLSSSNPQGDTILDLVPEVFFESAERPKEAKNFVRVSYDPQFLRFSRFSTLDTINQRGLFKYGFRGGKMAIFATHRSAEVSGTNFRVDALEPGAEDLTLNDQQFAELDRDVARRTQFVFHRSVVKVDIEVSPRVVLQTILARRKVEFESADASDTDTRSVENSLIYDFSSKLELGLIHRYGWIEYSSFPSQEFQQIDFFGDYLVGPELTFDFAVGVDRRLFETTGASDRDSLRYEAGLEWQPCSGTIFSIDIYKNSRTTVLGELVDGEGVRAQISKDLGKRLHYQVSGGVEDSTRDRLTGNPTGNDSSYEFLGNSLDYDVGRRFVIGVFHRYRRNDSSLGSGFERAQIGFRVRAEY